MAVFYCQDKGPLSPTLRTLSLIVTNPGNKKLLIKLNDYGKGKAIAQFETLEEVLCRARQDS
jgi:hypothetical protein